MFEHRHFFSCHVDTTYICWPHTSTEVEKCDNTRSIPVCLMLELCKQDWNISCHHTRQQLASDCYKTALADSMFAQFRSWRHNISLITLRTQLLLLLDFMLPCFFLMELCRVQARFHFMHVIIEPLWSARCLFTISFLILLFWHAHIFTRSLWKMLLLDFFFYWRTVHPSFFTVCIE